MKKNIFLTHPLSSFGLRLQPRTRPIGCPVKRKVLPRLRFPEQFEANLYLVAGHKAAVFPHVLLRKRSSFHPEKMQLLEKPILTIVFQQATEELSAWSGLSNP